MIGLLTVFLATALSSSLPIPAAELTSEYFPLLEGKRIGIFTNHTGMVGNVHIADTLLAAGFDVKIIFAPEHGFRGNADAGEHFDDSTDPATGLKIVSLFRQAGGKPSSETMSQIDVLLVDIQDVGLRFYTYYISLMNLMEVCADAKIPIILLDRPNPNGFYTDGPILEKKFRSGVGKIPVPVVHGMTLGELALMINGEKWLSNARTGDLTVIRCSNYSHSDRYLLPAPPSPNLPNMQSVWLYPSICLFEGTCVSLGRGTDFPFQVYGNPAMKGKFVFTPRSRPGAKKPPFLNRQCKGVDLRSVPKELIWKQQLNLQYVIDAYKKMNIGEKFFTSFFDNLIGTDYVRQMIIDGKSADEIKAMWKNDVENFKEKRKPYMLYD